VSAISKYADSLSCACTAAAATAIPHSANHSQTRRIPGSECIERRFEPLSEKSIFWHCLWIDCGRPRSGVVADCMWRTQAAYHYRQAHRDEESIFRECIAEAFLNDPTRNFWEEV